jgi:hypothetical protein
MITAPAQKAVSPKPAFSLVARAAFASFTTYCCMYGFRKPLTAATFDGIQVMGISFKSALVIAQVLGYMSSKFIGIKFISELDKSKRALYILSLIGAAHISLLLLALLPPPFNVFFLFINGLCLGLIWGIVFSYIEGRQYTDFLALVLSANFIFSSGIAKSLGRACIDYWKVPETDMPFVAGLFYIPLLVLSVWMLTKIPLPSAAERASRGERVALTGKERNAVFRKFLTGLIVITLLNLIFTILRDLKDNYSVEMLRALKPSFSPAIFTEMETTAAITVLFLLILLTGFKKHFNSIIAHHIAILSGLLVLLAAACLLKQPVFDPVIILTVYTIGLYVCYNTLQCLFLDRFIAAFKIRGNAGFFFYLMDAVGYLGSCFIIFNKEVFSPKLNWLNYFLQISFILGITGVICIFISWYYFKKKYQTTN